MELEFGNIHLYEGNYQTFLSEKVIRLEMLKASERKLTSILKKEEKWINMNPQARSTKSRERIERFEKMTSDLKNVSNIIKENEVTMTLESQKSAYVKLHPHDRLFSVLPLHHCYESTIGFLLPMACGCSVAGCSATFAIGSRRIASIFSSGVLYTFLFIRNFKWDSSVLRNLPPCKTTLLVLDNFRHLQGYLP